MALETQEDIVKAGVEAQAMVNKYLTLAQKAGEKLTKVTRAGIELGMVRDVPAKMIEAQAAAAEGKIADAMLAYATLHSKQVEICKANDADLGSLTMAGRVKIGGVETRGGGRG